MKSTYKFGKSKILKNLKLDKTVQSNLDFSYYYEYVANYARRRKKVHLKVVVFFIYTYNL